MAENRGQKQRRVRWSLISTLIAVALWGILSLSQSYTWNIEIPLVARIDTTREALAEPIPRTLNVTTRGDGWTLMQIASDEDILCSIEPITRSFDEQDSLRIYTFNERELINSINLPSSVSVSNIQPSSLRLIVTDLATKRVPLYYPEISIDARSGFQIIGQPRVAPDSVLLTGSAEALEKISHWYTESLSLKDIYTPVNVTLPVSDTLHGVVNVRPERASVLVEIQEVAELTMRNLYVINRNPVPDSVSQLLLYPNRVTVTLRGGAGELGAISDDEVIPYVELRPDRDTSGFVQPRILLPPGSNATVIAVQPERIRYIWRRPAKATGKKDSNRLASSRR